MTCFGNLEVVVEEAERVLILLHFLDSKRPKSTYN